MFILFQVPLINKNGTKSMHCIIRGKFVISPCRKSALFWIHAVILLFHAEILPCGPPLLPHSCAEPFLGVMQKYSFLGDIYTSALTAQFGWLTWPIGNWCDLSIKSDLVNSYLRYVRAGTAALIHILGIGPELYLLQQLNLILVGVLTFLYNVQCLHQSMQLLRTGWGLWCGG